MTRRTIGLLVTLALGLLAAPLATHVQPAEKLPRIGVLSPGIPPWEPGRGGQRFLQGLRDLGYIEGQTITLEVRWAENQPERYPDLVMDLLRLPVDIIVAGDAAAALAAQHATSTIPIVMAVSADPVRDGLVASLARLGGNITRLSIMVPEVTLKRLELLAAAMPGLSRVALLMDTGIPSQHADLHDHEAAARGLGVQLLPLEVRGPDEFVVAFQAATQGHAQALMMTQSPLFATYEARLAALALAGRLPTMSGEVGYAQAGGFMNYGPHLSESWYRAATLVDKILKGAKPGELPVEQPTQFELVINLKTAQALGLTIPPSLLFQADEVIR
jgi:putative tryptophan/tyrosine transport system substrate-binding protein